MKLTEAEKEFIAIHRERIKLDSTDWSRQPHVTQLQLMTMSPGVAQRLMADPRFCYCPYRQALIASGGESHVW